MPTLTDHLGGSEIEHSKITRLNETKESPPAVNDQEGNWSLADSTATSVDKRSATEARLQDCKANYAQPKNYFDPPKFSGHNETHRRAPEQLQERGNWSLAGSTAISVDKSATEVCLQDNKAKYTPPENYFDPPKFSEACRKAPEQLQGRSLAGSTATSVGKRSTTKTHLQDNKANYAPPENYFVPPRFSEAYRKAPEQLQGRIRDASQHRSPNEKENAFNSPLDKARTLRNNGKYRDAVDWYGKALVEEKKKQNNGQVLDIVCETADVFVKLEWYDEALKWYHDAFDQKKKLLGKNNPAVLETAKSIVRIFEKKGWHKEAKRWRFELGLEGF